MTRADLITIAKRLYWPLLAACMLMTLAPLWTGTIPPLSDFGGHVQMTDAWAKMDEVPLFADLFIRTDGLLSPNLLAARTVALLQPFMDTIPALRVFVSLSLVATILSLMWTLRVFERSRWLIFLCLPLVWNGLVMLGLINFVLSIAGMFLGVSAARRAAQRPGWRSWGVLALVGLFSVLAHPLGYLIVVPMALIILALSVRRPRDLLAAAALAPSAIVWWVWWRWAQRAPDIANIKLVGAGATTREHTAKASFDTLFYEGHELSAATYDTWSLVLVLGALLVLLMTQRPGAPAATEDTQAAPARRWWARAFHEAQRHPLLTMFVALGVGYFFVAPAYVRGVFISPRLIPPLLFTLCLLPRADLTRPVAMGAIAVSVVGAVWFPMALRADVARYEMAEVAPMVEVIDQIPYGVRAQCVAVAAAPIFRRNATNHNCNGLIQARRGGFAGGGFAHTSYNAVRLRSLTDFTQLRERQWTSYRHLRRHDYVIVRGTHAAPAAEHAELVHQADGHEAGGVAWSLYRVIKPLPIGVAYEADTEGKGGFPFRWGCPEHHLLSGLVVGAARDGAGLVNVQPVCRLAERAGNDLYFRGQGQRGPRFGGAQQHQISTLTCRRGHFITGLAGDADRLVKRVGALCGDPTRAMVGPDDPWWQVFLREWPRRYHGSPGDTPFWLRCPTGMVASGITGRTGALIDALGIACSPIEAVVPEAPLPPSTEPLPPPD